MTWTKKKLEYHQEAARRLDAVISEAFDYLRDNEKVSEYELREFILLKIKKQGMEVFDSNVIVAFAQNTQYVHYFPSQYCKKLKAGDLVMIDAWARLKKPGAPYADITRMGISQLRIKNYELKIKQDLYALLIKAQDKAIRFLRGKLKKGELPTGREVDKAARNFLAKSLKGEIENINKIFCHTLGHSLGIKGPHGQVNGFSPKNKQPIHRGMGYTIEPGLYFPGKYGLRSEIDIFIDNQHNLELTSKRYIKLEIV